MSFTTILAPVENDDVSRAAFRAALRLARRFGAKLDILSFAPPPAPLLSMSALSSQAAGDAYDALRDAAAATLQQAVQEADAMGVAYEASLMGSPLISLQEAVAQRALLADLIVAPRPKEKHESQRRIVHGALFQAPAPLLVWPPDRDVEATDGLGKNILLAWDGRKPASAAARMAAPLMASAEKVTVVCVDQDYSEEAAEDEPGAAVVEWLAKKGVRASLLSLEGADVDETLLGAADEQGADLIVMGGYGHSQMLEALFGGVTETMLRKSPLPLFMAH